MIELTTRKTHMSPVGPTLSRDEICELLGISAVTLGVLVSKGVLPKIERGLYELAPVVTRYCEYLRTQRNRSCTPELDAVKADKARQLKARADLLEMEAEYRAGNLTTISRVEKVFGERFVRFRSRILAIPSRAAALCVGEDAAAIYATLTKLAHEALTELSTDGLRDANDTRRPARKSVGTYSSVSA